MIKSKTLRFAFLAAALMMLTIVAFAFSMQSHAAAPSVSKSTAHVSILKQKGGDAFGKTTLTVTHGVAFNFDNRTNTSQSVTSNGKTLVSINAKSSASYTFKTAGTYTLSLASNSAAKLTVTAQ